MKHYSEYEIFNRSIGWVIVIHVVLLILKLIWVTNWSLELHYEEAQYWLWSTKLDWSYYSKPGMVAWMNYLSTGIFGNTVLGVKFPALIAGFVVSIALFFSAERLFGDRRISVLSSFMVYLMPFYYSVALFHSTDSFLVAFGSVSFYFFIKAIQENKWTDWILTGFFLGLSMLTKYSALILLFSYGIFLWIYNKKMMFRFYIATLVMLITMLPFWIWIIQNDFISFKHLLGYIHNQENQDSLKNIFKALGLYIAGQIAVISPFLFPFLLKAEIDKNKNMLLLVFPAIISFLFYFLVLIKNGKEPNINWPFFNYFPLAIFFSVVILKNNRLKWLLPTSAFMFIFVFTMANTSVFDKVGLGKVISPKNDPSNLYHQWEQISNGITEDTAISETLLMADNYKVASAVQFYIGNRQKVYYLGSGSRRNQLSYWNEISQIDTKGKRVTFITTDTQFPKSLVPEFDEISLAKIIPVYWRNEEVKRIYLYHAVAKTELQSILKGY